MSLNALWTKLNATDLSTIVGGKKKSKKPSINLNAYGLYYSHGQYHIDPQYVAKIVSDGIGGNL